jgi:hypothetical protein
MLFSAITPALLGAGLWRCRTLCKLSTNLPLAVLSLPTLQLPLDALAVGLLMWMKPSQPFCAVMQHAGTEPLFRTMASSLPLVSLIPLGRPLLREGADVCNPLIAWMQVGRGGWRCLPGGPGGVPGRGPYRSAWGGVWGVG